ncbi:hypothetical protein [Granulicoccus phenolivorans]|uniref:hypothetical protein n=1 Tax=Granulicoccus phenolivorans TaxID=266854 RepID=UPI0003FA987F|nr:hypothetical protein [Granulicoccus phenolivorans]
MTSDPRPDPAPASTGPTGFELARLQLRSFEAREHVRHHLGRTAFAGDARIAAVHVENTARVDRVHLTAFDDAGRAVGHATVYLDVLTERLDLTVEFSHDTTGMTVPPHSDLAHAVARADGWVVDMAALRASRREVDVARTRRAALLALIGDLLGSGEARGFLLGPLDPTRPRPGGPGRT